MEDNKTSLKNKTSKNIYLKITCTNVLNGEISAITFYIFCSSSFYY